MSFKEIKGQDSAVNILKTHIQNSRLAQSYIFSGPQGVGKSLIAKTLAKALNCQQDGLDSCDTCSSCLRIEKNTHPDVHMLDFQDGEIKIEHIRQLQREISLRPYEAKHKVFIIKNAHNLNAASSNAFLKTLEEASGKGLIILITEKPALLLDTIASRCRVLRFFPLAREALEKILLRDYALPEDSAHFLAYFCEGRTGQALRLKDSEFMREKNRLIDEFSLLKRHELEARFGQRDRDSLRSSLNILSAWFRDIYLLKIGLGISEIINLDRKEDLIKIMPQFSFPDLDNLINFISSALWCLRHNVNVRLLEANLKEEIWKARLQ